MNTLTSVLELWNTVTVRFETEVLDTDNFQGNAVVNYTDREVPYTPYHRAQTF